MRCFPLLTMALLATAANADTFDITFNPVATIKLIDGTSYPPIFSTGTIVTDGTCTNCSIDQVNDTDITHAGIDTIDVPGTVIHFGLGEPVLLPGQFGSVTLNVATDSLTGSIEVGTEFLAFGDATPPCPPSGPCPSGPGTYFFSGGGDVNEWGTFTVAPEPAGWLLLTTCAIPIVIWRLRRRGTSERG